MSDWNQDSDEQGQLTICPKCTSTAPEDPMFSLSELRDFFKNDITLFVGQERTPIRMFTKLLTKESRYFKGLVEGNFAEKGTTEAEISEYDVATVELYRVLLLSLSFKQGLCHGVRMEWDSRDDDWLVAPVKVYHFADFISSDKICELILEYVTGRLYDNRETTGFGYIAPEAVKIACKLPKGHVMRRTLVEGFAIAQYAWQGDKLAALCDYPKEFLASVLLISRVRSTLVGLGLSWHPPKFSDGFLTKFRSNASPNSSEEVDQNETVRPIDMRYLVQSEVDQDVRIYCPDMKVECSKGAVDFEDELKF